MANIANTLKNSIIQLELATYRKNKRGEKQIIKKIRNNCDVFFKDEDDKEFDNCFKLLMDSQLLNPYFSCNFFPLDFNKYGIYDNIISFSNDLNYELRWIIYCLSYYSDKINFFISKREDYDSYILLDKFDEAMQAVNEVEEELGVSYWSMECKFYLYSKMDLDVSELIKTLPRNIFGAILSYYELKNRDNVTFDEYTYIVEKEIERAKKMSSPPNIGIMELYNYMVASSFCTFDDKEILPLVSAIRRCSLIDKYIFIIYMCNFAFESETDSIYNIIKKYISTLECINDTNLVALRFIFDSDENRINNYTLKNRLDDAKRSFINGHLQEARQEAINLLQLYPNNTQAINLFIETNTLLGEEAEPFKNTTLGELIKNLTSVYKLDVNRNDCMQFISMLTNRCSFSSWSKVLINCLFSKIQSETEEKKVIKMLSNVQHLDIETVIACIEIEQSTSLIEQKININNEYVKFRKSILERNFERASQLCQVESIKDILVVCDNHKSFNEKYAHLRGLEGAHILMAIRALEIFLNEINLDKYMELALTLITDLVINNVYTSMFIPLDKFIEYIDRGDKEIRKNICSCIIYYVYAYYYDSDKKEDLGIICEDFFYFQNIDRPSQISVDDGRFKKEYLVYFLKKICNLKVLATAVCAFSTSQERDKERVDICNILCQIDSKNIKKYEKEIRDLTQKLMINAELMIIEENRIHVNEEGVKERIMNNYKNDFARYKFYQDARLAHFREVFELLEKNKEEEKIIKYNSLYNAPERILNEIIIHIRDAFVSSDEYGLNGYLSLNIRHGTLADELRSPLFKARLNVKRDVNTNEYIVDDKWIAYGTEKNKEIIRKAITKFYLSTEKIIDKLKNKYIQIKTEDNDSEGIFDYCLYDYTRTVLTSHVELAQSFEEFIDIVMDILWVITEKNLERMRGLIRGEIANDYQLAFNTLKQEIGDVTNKTILRELNQKISEASIDMPNVLDRICYWFNRSTESKHNDFDLEFVFKMGLETIRNMHPEKVFIVEELEKTDSDKFPGICLKSFESIFYNLFENIYRNATEKNGKIVIGCKLKYKDGKATIYLENDFDCQNDFAKNKQGVEETKRKIESDEYLKLINMEGGTGIPKIMKILKVDLRYNPKMDFGYIEDRNKFYMLINFS